ncbi:MAG: hypothetical protein GF388_05680 [Candidatus Aegiribacteria sp.]|nr:hypothetical protein [Candidatus Aegiribacteria sp.]
MAYLDKALVATVLGDRELEYKYNSLALEKEKEAADLLRDHFDAEPTRSVLYRSAASIALKCDRPNLAEKLAAQGLSGNPPDDVAEELRILFENITFHRHLKLEEMNLTRNSINITLFGNDVAHGMVSIDEYIKRLKTLEQITMRTAERKRGRPYRSGGNPPKDIQKLLKPFLTLQKPASFSATIRFGSSQMSLFDSDDFEESFTDDVVHEVVETLENYENGTTDKLSDRIDNDDYYINFISLAKKLSPDGDSITKVGLSTLKREKPVILEKPRDICMVVREIVEKKADLDQIPNTTITGTLLYASKLRKKNPQIKIKPSKGKAEKVRVPVGMLDDIVRPLWDKQVIATVAPDKKNELLLVDIIEQE